MSNQPVEIDVQAAAKACQALGRALGEALDVIAARFARVAEALSAAFRPAVPMSDVALRAEARARYGGSGDLFGLWQSSACAGWLHESCPADPLIDCRCTCHGGELR